jgi:serine protease Do
MPVSLSKSHRENALKVHYLTSAATLMLMSMGMSVGAYAGPLPESFADLAQKVTPAVVNISSTHQSDEAATMPEMPFQFPEGSPFEEFFKQFQQQGGHRPHKVVSLGSGFIVDPAGFVVTNNHVVDGAKDIEVTLNDGKEYPAKLIGTDSKTDLALLKVDAGRPLPSVPFGNSDATRIGDWVLAVGNPFGLGGSVTAGIVSARGRDIDSGPYDDFLQIDASINQGNSGGPTFDAEGEVVGINTAIASPNGGSVGIGFAIPSNLAKPIIAELKSQGHIDRGWLGVAIQEVTPDLAQGLGLEKPQGALIATVQPNSPAEGAGLKAGDVVREYADRIIETPKDLSRAVAETQAGSVVPIRIWRGAQEEQIKVKIAALDENAEAKSALAADQGSSASSSGLILGAKLAPIGEEERQRLGLDAATQGALVVSLADDSPLAEAGLRPGDVILKVNDQWVKSPSDVTEAASSLKGSGKSAAFLVRRDGDDRFIAVHLG